MIDDTYIILIVESVPDLSVTDGGLTGPALEHMRCQVGQQKLGEREEEREGGRERS